MKRQSEKYRLGILAELNITPLLDLAFVLLIIFVITSPFLAESSAITIENGSASAMAPEEPSEVATVSIDETRALFLDGAPVAAANLRSALVARRLEASGGGEFGVVVKADRDLAVHDLLDVMEQIKLAGISRVGVLEQTEPETATIASSP